MVCVWLGLKLHRRYGCCCYLADTGEVYGDINRDFAARVSAGHYVRNGVICERLKDCIMNYIGKITLAIDS